MNEELIKLMKTYLKREEGIDATEAEIKMNIGIAMEVYKTEDRLIEALRDYCS